MQTWPQPSPYEERQEEPGIPFEVVPSVKLGCNGSDVILTQTPGLSTVLGKDRLNEGGVTKGGVTIIDKWGSNSVNEYALEPTSYE